jgi:hypothetical protein
MRRALAVCVPDIQFLIPFNGVWRTPAEHHVTAPLLLDYYVNSPWSSEEVCAAAIWIHADGKPWNSPEASESFAHISHWLSSITSLLHGESFVTIWAWEESGMEAKRQDRLVILEERTHHRDFQLPPVCFELERFARCLLEATIVGAELERELGRLAQERFPAMWNVDVAEKRAERVRQALEIEREQRRLKWQFWKRLWIAPESLADQLQERHLHEVVDTVVDTLRASEISTAWEELKAALDRKRLV